MADKAERNRLRYAGRIPQETLDYLSAKRRADSRLRWWEIPILFLVAASIVLLILLLFRSHGPLLSSDTLFKCTVIVMLLTTLWRRLRSCHI
jgi:hypothetical protein